MALLDVGLRHFVFLSAILFSLGAFTLVSRPVPMFRSLPEPRVIA